MVERSAVFFKRYRKELIQWKKKVNKPSILIGQWSKKLTDGQSNLLLSNQAHALYGAIFPWLRDTRAFLLLNHLEFFLCILLISNHNDFSCARLQIALALQERAILLVFGKFTRAYLFQIALEIMWLPVQISVFHFPAKSAPLFFQKLTFQELLNNLNDSIELKKLLNEFSAFFLLANLGKLINGSIPQIWTRAAIAA